MAKVVDLRKVNAARIAFENQRVVEGFSEPRKPNDSSDSGRTEVQDGLSSSCVCTLLNRRVPSDSFFFVFAVIGTSASCQWNDLVSNLEQS